METLLHNYKLWANAEAVCQTKVATAKENKRSGPVKGIFTRAFKKQHTLFLSHVAVEELKKHP